MTSEITLNVFKVNTGSPIFLMKMILQWHLIIARAQRNLTIQNKISKTTEKFCMLLEVLVLKSSVNMMITLNNSLNSKWGKLLSCRICSPIMIAYLRANCTLTSLDLSL